MMFTFVAFIKIGYNLAIMFSLMILVLSSSKIGLLNLLTSPLDKVQDHKKILLFWFIFSCIITGFVPDTLAAIIIMPMAFLYAEKRNINMSNMLLAIGFGTAAGSDLTYFGGGDNIVAWTLFEKYLGHSLNIVIWAKMFWVPTIIGAIITGVWLWFKVFKKGQSEPQTFERNIGISLLFILQSLLIIVGIGTAFVEAWKFYTIGIAIISLIICRLNFKDLKKLPYKALYIWTGAYIFGNIVSTFIKAHFVFTLPAYLYTLPGIIVILLLLGCITNIMTNTGLTTIVLPIVFAATFVDIPWLFILCVKAIGLSYLTILANGCLAVSSSYGLKQNELFKAGLPIVIMQVIVFAIYFYLTRGLL